MVNNLASVLTTAANHLSIVEVSLHLAPNLLFTKPLTSCSSRLYLNTYFIPCLDIPFYNNNLIRQWLSFWAWISHCDHFQKFLEDQHKRVDRVYTEAFREDEVDIQKMKDIMESFITKVNSM